MLKKKNIKASVDEDGNLHFWEDGVNERDWLILLTSIVFFGGIAVGLVLTVVGMFMGFEIPDKYIQLIRTMDIPITTIIGGIFANKVAQTITTRKDDNYTSNEVEVTNKKSDMHDDSI